MPSYQWIQYSTARQQLALRLADPNNVFWTDTENGYYICEALRTFNALTEIWNGTLAFQATPAQTWYNISQLAGSPRLRTLTDSYLYTGMQYHLLEPPTASTWTGTSQFSIADLSGALERRRDEMIQAVGCNLDQLPAIPSVPNTRRTYLPDSTLEPRRARFISADSSTIVTMTREDTLAWNAFESQRLQTWKVPQAWSVISGPPQAMDVDTSPNVPGKYDVICLRSGPRFLPPVSALLGVPDDWSWLAKWGALADLLGRDSEATDRQRADYCLKRFTDGLEIMKQSNWLLTATINGVVVDTPSLREMDGFFPEWETNANAWPTVVTAGIDFLAACPVAPLTGVSCVVVGNAPIPVFDTDFVEVGRDVFDAILDYAQVLASFKMGGQEFMDTQDLEKNFFRVALENNKRLSKLAIFSDMLHLEGRRQDINQPR